MYSHQNHYSLLVSVKIMNDSLITIVIMRSNMISSYHSSRTLSLQTISMISRSLYGMSALSLYEKMHRTYAILGESCMNRASLDVITRISRMQRLKGYY